ncbi:MAG: PhoH family protein [bacterium]
MPQKHKKFFVFDTNVILHDSSCIYQFADNDIVIPMTVLEELDHFKKGNEEINFHAREFARDLDALSGEKIFDDGISLGPNLGKILIRLDRDFHEDLRFNFISDKPDHRILNAAYMLAKEQTDKQVILVSKDVNLRMKAKSVGLTAQDYKTDHVQNIDTLYNGHRFEENVDPALISKMYEAPFEIDADLLKTKVLLTANEFVIMRNEKQSALATYDPEQNLIKRVDKVPACGITPRNAEQTFALNALMNLNIPLVSVSGKAGTGKTLLALAAALEKKRHYRQIYLARPVVPLSNKDIGFLPGDIKSKLDPYMQPLHDNLAVIEHHAPGNGSNHRHVKDLLEQEKLVVSPLSYIRGRSLVKVYFIVDEAQNLTPHEIKTIITRAGEGTKFVFTGDIFQIDHPYLDTLSNGLSYLIEKMHGQHLYAHINLEKGERSGLAELASNLL